jgi:hypothetical protein
VIDMVSLGSSDDVIIEKIHATQAKDFDTSLPVLRTLKAAKVSDAVTPTPVVATTLQMKRG